MANHKNDDIPDSWDDPAPSPSSSAFSKFNVNAAEFVPTWGAPAATNVAQAPETAKQADSSVPLPKSTKEPPVSDASAADAPKKDTAQVTSKPKKEQTSQPSTSTSSVKTNMVDGDDVVEEDDEEEVSVSHASAAHSSDGPKKEHANIVFIGHVDAGKSTIGGQVLLLTGAVDKRTMEKYEREAKEAGRESWFLSWALDTNPEERDKGKTVEVGRSSFETEKKQYTILDAPGHKSYVANMMEGALQADIAILVISARKGEFETGFERGGQTREHALLVKTAGVKQLVILINKMDDSTVNWSEDRYNECKDKLTPYLKSIGYNPKTDLTFMPLSGFTGANVKEPVGTEICPWYDGPSFLGFLDNLAPFVRASDGPLRIPIIGRFKEMGTVITGKIESGSVKKGDQLLLMPNRTNVEVVQIWSDDDEVEVGLSGDNVRVKLKGVEEEDVQVGFILCDTINPCRAGKVFDAQVSVLEHKNIICAGYRAIMHLHALQEPVTVQLLICLLDKKTAEKSDVQPKFVKPGQKAIMRFECADGIVCMETGTLKEVASQLSRFTLREEGKTIGFGKILKIVQ